MSTELNISPAKLSMKERQRQLREDAILDAAVEFLQSKGLSAMTLDDITEAIGISRPTLYQHFSSKEEMVVHIALRNLQRGLEGLRELDKGRPALDRLVEFLDWAMQSRFGSCRCVFSDLANVLISVKERNEKYRLLAVEFKERFAGLISEGQAEGTLRTDIRPELLAATVIAIYKSPDFDELIQQGSSSVAEIRECILRLLKAPAGFTPE